MSGNISSFIASSVKMNHIDQRNQIKNIMKKVVFLFLTLSCIVGVSAQVSKNIQPDPRVVEVFGQETVNSWIQNHPDSIAYYNFIVNESYNITDFPEEKMHAFDNFQEFTLLPEFSGAKTDYSEAGLKKINVLKYDYDRDELQMVFYRLKGTKKVIGFYSENHLRSLWNEKSGNK